MNYYRKESKESREEPHKASTWEYFKIGFYSYILALKSFLAHVPFVLAIASAYFFFFRLIVAFSNNDTLVWNFVGLFLSLGCLLCYRIIDEGKAIFDDQWE